MNNRIKELAKQATTVEDTYPAGCNGYPTPSYSFDKEKFAELIIRECMKVAHGAAAAGDPIKESIAEHFGVK